MIRQLQLAGITVDVVLKDIKNIHLSVHPPTGRVRIAAPARMSMDSVRLFAVAKLDWIKRQQAKFLEQQREAPREYMDRESHYVWGKRYLLSLCESDQPPRLELARDRIFLRVRPGTGDEKKKALIDEWYRDELKRAAPPLITKWEPLLGVKVERFFVQRMKTKWGSCNRAARSIRVNTDLAKKPHECLEYIVVHEMVHLREPTHNERFVSLMDHFMPNWQFHRDLLNRLPVRHEHWRLLTRLFRPHGSRR